MNHIAYIKGVLDGDACIEREAKHRPRIVLAVKSRIFADKFRDALKCIGLLPYITEQHRMRTFNGHTFKDDKFFVRARCDENMISAIQNYHLTSYEEKVSYLTGFFDAEGSFYIKRYLNRTCYHLQISNSDIAKLERAKKILEEIGISTKLRNYASHIPYVHTQKKIHLEKLIEVLDPPFTRSVTGHQRGEPKP
jgi:intein-encoded DNA endonuclease-like protein